VPAAFGIGLDAGWFANLAVTKLKAKFKYDDSLDVFGVHGVGATIGMLMLGFLATATVNPAIVSTFQANGVPVSLVGGGSQFTQPTPGRAVHGGLRGHRVVPLAKNVNGAGWPARACEDEDAGLTFTQHGERAYSEITGENCL